MRNRIHKPWKGGPKRKVYWSLGGMPQPDAKGNGGVKFGSASAAKSYAQKMGRAKKEG